MSLIAPSMETSILIREFQLDDASCVEFVVLSVLQEWGFMPSAKDLQELEAMQRDNPFEAFFVAEDPVLGVVGCAGYIRIDNKTCELRKIYLLKRFRGQGLGQKLLEACIKAALEQGHSRMRLEVNSAMSMSAPFYLKSGFSLAEGEKPRSVSADQVYYKALSSL